MDITVELVSRLIHAQFPQWSNLPITPVKKSGHDNRTFHLGDEMTVRLPFHKRYEAAVEKEMKWLPVFAKHISLPITTPVAKGAPTAEYPLQWSVNNWLAGEILTPSSVTDLNQLALDLAGFLQELAQVDTTNGIPAGVQNFHRGGSLAVYDEETRKAIEEYSGSHNKALLTQIWEQALATHYQQPPRWVHGDIAGGNLLVKNGRLAGVIDFGTCGVGDPSSDLVMAWTFFDKSSRALFLSQMGLGEDTTDRARGWALWKALITLDTTQYAPELVAWAKEVVDIIVAEYTACYSK